jgi:hypothetical protein
VIGYVHVRTTSQFLHNVVIRCARASLAGQIRSFLSFVRSLAERVLLHHVSQVQRPVWTTNYQHLAPGELGSSEHRQPIIPYNVRVSSCVVGKSGTLRPGDHAQKRYGTQRYALAQQW